MTEFVQNNNIDHPLTADGERVIEYLERGLTDWEEKIGTGMLPGNEGHYYVNVMKLHSMSKKQWLLEQSNAAEAVLSTIRVQEAKNKEKADLAATMTGQSELERQLSAFKEEVGKQVAELQTENQRLRELVEAAGKATVDKTADDKPADSGKPDGKKAK